MQIQRITVRPPDLVARIAFIRTEEGGRQGPAWSGYRSNHDFGLPGTLNDAAHEYIGQDTASPGETVRANVWLFAPELQSGRLFPGFTFTVQEGARLVARGVIEEVVNVALRRSAA
jgi:translation elongation factor EF-Tu-like GTPase